jgi:hypothetical protein
MRSGGSPAAIPDEVTQNTPDAQSSRESGPLPAQDFQLRTFMHKPTQPPAGCDSSQLVCDSLGRILWFSV